MDSYILIECLKLKIDDMIYCVPTGIANQILKRRDDLFREIDSKYYHLLDSEFWKEMYEKERRNVLIIISQILKENAVGSYKYTQL